MTRLNLKLVGQIFAFLMASSQISCSTQDKKESADQLSSVLDTLNYGKKDYDLMRAYFNADSLFLSRLDKGIKQGDTSSIKINRLLATDYASRSKIGMTDREIDAMIFLYYTMKNAIERLNEIDNRLPKTDADEISAKTDSIINSIEALKKELRRN